MTWLDPKPKSSIEVLHATITGIFAGFGKWPSLRQPHVTVARGQTTPLTQQLQHSWKPMEFEGVCLARSPAVCDPNANIEVWYEHTTFFTVACTGTCSRMRSPGSCDCTRLYATNPQWITCSCFDERRRRVPWKWWLASPLEPRWMVGPLFPAQRPALPPQVQHAICCWLAPEQSKRD